MSINIPLTVVSSPPATCGCGYVNCCGQCVPHEQAAQLTAENPDVVMTHCSPECSCGGIPTLISFLRGGAKNS